MQRRLLWPGVLGVLLAGCAGDELECGPGTIQEDGLCVVADTAFSEVAPGDTPATEATSDSAAETDDDSTIVPPDVVTDSADATYEATSDAPIDSTLDSSPDGVSDAGGDVAPEDSDSTETSADVGVDAVAEADASDTAPDATDTGSDILDASVDAPPDVSSDGGSSCGSLGSLVGGTQRLIDLFVLPAGILVIRNDAVVLIGRDGVVKKTVTWPREIASAAMDGATLLVADKAAVTTVGTPDLTSVLEFFVTETCLTGAVVSKSRYLCGSGAQIYTYDYTTGVQIAKAKPYIHGLPMRRVPGTDDFVTLDIASSPADFYLYTTTTSGEPTFINESPYHGAFAVTTNYAFHVPADRLVTSEGILLKIHAPGCTPSGTGCFEKDGVLGTLTTGQTYLAVTDDGANKFYGIAANPATTWTDVVCTAGCETQQVDVAKRLITSKKTATITDYRATIAFRLDVTCNRLVLGHSRPDPSASWKELGYRVVVLEY